MDASTRLHARNRDLAQPGPDINESISQILEKMFGVLRRQRYIFLAVVPACLLLGGIHLLTTPAIFTAHTQLVIDSSKLKVLQQQDTNSGNERPIDAAQIETQVEILRSRDLGLSVIKSEHLENDPEFVGAGSRLMARILDMFGADQPESPQSQTSDALNSFLKKRTVSRVGQTYVLDIGFSALDPARAATLANAMAEAYINSQLEAKFQAVRRASSWLQDRMKELRQQASDADQAVLVYKEKNAIVDVGGTAASGPRLLGEQQLEELNTQLSTARAAAAEANAKLARIDDVLKQDIPDATVTDTLRSEVITKLRNNYLDLAAREAVWAAKYGPNHLAVTNLRTQMYEIRKSIRDELARIAQSYKSDAAIANARIDGLEKSLGQLISNSQAINRDKLGLKDLERSAQAYHTIYDNFLQRYMEAIQQQSFPITESRIISTAEIPTRKSSPISFIVLAIAGILGLILSSVAAVLRESTDRALRTAEQVESFFNLPCLAKVPAMAAIAAPPQKPRGPAVSARQRVAADGKATAAPDEAAAQSARTISDHDPLTRSVVSEPLSIFAEAFRSIKMAVDLDGMDRKSKVIGVTSTLPDEGKTTVSCNFAQAAAQTGRRVILIDGDLRNPSLTRTLAPDAMTGLMQVLNGKCSLEDAIYHDPETGLSFLPAVVPPRHAHSNEVLASAAFSRLIDELRKAYEYVIIDFPPVALVVDVRAGAQSVDSLLFVVEWGHTNKNLILRELRAAPELSDKILGLILNKVNVKILQRYEAHFGKSYYGQYYGRYG